MHEHKNEAVVICAVNEEGSLNATDTECSMQKNELHTECSRSQMHNNAVECILCNVVRMDMLKCAVNAGKTQNAAGVGCHVMLLNVKECNCLHLQHIRNA